MRSKLSLSALLSVAAVGSVMLAAPALACPFANKANPSNSITADSPAGSTNSSINFDSANDVSNTDSAITASNWLNSDSSNLNKLAIVGAGVVGLLGLGAGGTFLKSKFAKQTSQTPAAMPGAEAPVVEPATFPIVVPAEMLNSSREESAAEVTSVR